MSDNDQEQIESQAKSLFELSAVNIHGQNVDLSTYNTFKAILVLNVACKCGLTSDHYKQLVELYKKYHTQGFQVLGFPCNQFGAQEPWPADEILKFTKDEFGVEFPLFEKIDVNGPNTHPVFKFLRNNSELFQNHATKKIPWNFAKFLIDGKTGHVAKYFSPTVNPVELEGDLQKLLQ